MDTDISTVVPPRRHAVVSDHEIDAATDAYLANPGAGPFTFKSGQTIDVAKAIELNPRTARYLSDPANQDFPKYRRSLVLTAVIMSLPTEPFLTSATIPKMDPDRVLSTAFE